MTLDELREKISNLKIWKQGDKRAPHKPLLLLWAMGRAVCGEERLVPFDEIEERLIDLHGRFWPPSPSFRPVYPFSRLIGDELWEVPNASAFSRTSSDDFLVSELREFGVTGGLPAPLHRLLATDPGSAKLAARQLVDEYFHASMRRDILVAVGLWGSLGVAD